MEKTLPADPLAEAPREFEEAYERILDEMKTIDADIQEKQAVIQELKRETRTILEQLKAA